MNKIGTLISLTLAMYGTNTFSDSVYAINSPLAGFYAGGNAGYIWSATNTIKSRAHTNFAAPASAPASTIISNALAEVIFGTQDIKLNGFTGGGQIGYNSQVTNSLMLGLEFDLDANARANKTLTFNNSFAVPAGLGTYNANIVVTKNLNYLGFLKGRLGLLATPTLLVYGTGGYAFGGASLKTIYSITQTVSFFSPINHQQSKSNNTLSGWGAGGGVEWMFSPQWSMKLEYDYYYLGPVNTPVNLTQYLTGNNTAPFASVTADSLAQFSESTLRVGVNYHFNV